MRLPEIGFESAAPLVFVACIIGVMVGTHAPWWVECVLVAPITLFNSSRIVQEQKLGALSYHVISVAFVAGLVIGDINCWF